MTSVLMIFSRLVLFSVCSSKFVKSYYNCFCLSLSNILLHWSTIFFTFSIPRPFPPFSMYLSKIFFTYCLIDEILSLNTFYIKIFFTIDPLLFSIEGENVSLLYVPKVLFNR